VPGPMLSRPLGLAVGLPAQPRSEGRYRQRAAPGIRFVGVASPAVRFLRACLRHPLGLNCWEAVPPRNRKKPGWAFKAQEAEYSEPLGSSGEHAVWGLLRSANGLAVAPIVCHHVPTGRHQEPAHRRQPGWAPSQGAALFIAAIHLPQRTIPVPWRPRIRLHDLCQANDKDAKRSPVLDKSFRSRLHRWPWLGKSPPSEHGEHPGARLRRMEINKLLRPGPFDSTLQVQTHYHGPNKTPLPPSSFARNDGKIRALAEAIHQAIDGGKGYICSSPAGRLRCQRHLPAPAV